METPVVEQKLQDGEVMILSSDCPICGKEYAKEKIGQRHDCGPMTN